MHLFEQFANDSIFVITAGGDTRGPYKCAMSDETLTVFDSEFRAEEGDTIQRPIPNKQHEHYRVLEIRFNSGFKAIPAHYSLKVEKIGSLASRHPQSTVVHISNSSNVQVGSHNQQNITGGLRVLLQEIDRSPATPEAKREVKQRLERLLSHPVVGSILGGAAQALIERLAKQ